MPRSKKLITMEAIAQAVPRASDWIMWDGGDGAVKGLGLKITPTGTKVWILKYRMAGGRSSPTRRYTIGDVGHWAPKAARTKAKELLAEVSAGIDPMLKKKQARIGSVAALVKDFTAFLEEGGKRSSGETARILNKDVVPAWGNRAPAAITKVDAKNLLKVVYERGPIMANRTLAAIKQMFSWAVDEDYLPAHPFPKLKPMAPEESRDRTPSDAELVEIWTAADVLAWPFGPAVQLMMLSGQRRDECSSMAKEEVTVASATWTLPPSKTKNKQPHDIHLPQFLLNLIARLPNVSNKLYFTTTGETPISGWSKAKDQIDLAILNRRIDSGRPAITEPLQISMRKGDKVRVVAQGHSPFTANDEGRMIGVVLGGRWGFVRLALHPGEMVEIIPADPDWRPFYRMLAKIGYSYARGYLLLSEGKRLLNGRVPDYVLPEVILRPEGNRFEYVGCLPEMKPYDPARLDTIGIGVLHAGVGRELKSQWLAVTVRLFEFLNTPEYTVLVARLARA